MRHLWIDYPFHGLPQGFTTQIAESIKRRPIKRKRTWVVCEFVDQKMPLDRHTLQLEPREVGGG
jgi:hypothetical protein